MAEPYFDNPPIFEVSFSVQFEPIKELHIGYIGLLWGIYKERYPNVESMEELPHQIEKFGVIARDLPKPLFQMHEKFPPPRMRIESEGQDYIIQIQKDRFVYNWKKNPTNENDYPRYNVLRQNFLDELNRFTEFLQLHELDALEFNQVEFTYVNHIDADNHTMQFVFNDIGQESNYPDDLELEAFTINFKHIISKLDNPIGRLYTAINKAQVIADASNIFKLTFTARSRLINPSLSGVTEVMDILRSAINSSFEAITTKDMHQIWKKGED